ncbi:glycosyltransferase [Salegentibacter salinarum]|uniref:Glycosyltransferase n=1 Tax=Salegentibacter salinarum TaxID=447422 RepID=A0A2N0TN87_9FLAO|nr:glycosyltransferase [Salegentibacter salinarum]PKD16209.1 glycosyltransferase [Salegentibacter salinarum]SKB67898.1 Spore maturation protein CgeB [Salegentibacter salinarum]
MNIVIIGLSITSSWGNGHATTYRSLLKALSARGHEIHFLERDVPYYAQHRDLPNPSFCKVNLYKDLEELKKGHTHLIESADVVIVGSYVPEGVAVGNWVIDSAKGLKAFYDIDTPVTLGKLEKKDYEYITPELIAKYDLYLSFSGGTVLEFLEEKYGSPRAKDLFCSVDPDLYYPNQKEEEYLLGYLGTYSKDRQSTLSKLLFETAWNYPNEKFILAGSQFPDKLHWPTNLNHIDHLPPAEHCNFYNSQRYTINVTRADMIKFGHSPSVRLFEAAACGVPIISDFWEGIDDIFSIEKEILIAKDAKDVACFIEEINESERLALAENAREKVLIHHTSQARAKQLEAHINEVLQPSQ